jgi:hypothetical protein
VGTSRGRAASAVLGGERVLGQLVERHLLRAGQLLAREQDARGAVLGAERAQEQRVPGASVTPSPTDVTTPAPSIPTTAGSAGR